MEMGGSVVEVSVDNSVLLPIPGQPTTEMTRMAAVGVVRCPGVSTFNNLAQMFNIGRYRELSGLMSVLYKKHYLTLLTMNILHEFLSSASANTCSCMT